ncbi:hypothetical protein N9J83_06120 [Opitutales bacterium]|nr:hypothetical protein [Opitutales bacterium]
MSISLNSNSQATQLDMAFSSKMKLNQDSMLRMSSGKSIVNSFDDAGQLAVSAKTSSHYVAETHLAIGTDYSTESTRLIKNQFLIEDGATLLNKFKNLTAADLVVLGA